MGASFGQQPANGTGPHPAPGFQQNGQWRTQFQHGPADQQKFAPHQFGQQPVNGAGSQLSWMWASDWKKMLPEAWQTLYNEGLAGLETRLTKLFQGLSPQQEVNIEAKLLAALEREKDAAAEREDYDQAKYYKREIDILMGRPKASPSAASFARAASFLASASKGKGKGKGDERFSKGRGKGKGEIDDDFAPFKGRGKGEVDLDDGFAPFKGKGKGEVDIDEGFAPFKGKGKGEVVDIDEGFSPFQGKGKGKSQDSFASSMGQGKGNVNESFARRERAMEACNLSFATDGAFAGSFSTARPPNMSFAQTQSFGTRSSFAAPRTDSSFAAGLPRSAAGQGQPQLPVGVSFGAATTYPTEGYNTRMPISSSFGYTNTTQYPPPVPSTGSFGTCARAGSFATASPENSPCRMIHPGLEMIRE